jgi:mRNA-degrading endonuclease toxin of MazEF toxin-antitoxin module
VLPICLALAGCSGSITGSGTNGGSTAGNKKKAKATAAKSTQKVDAKQLEKAIAASSQAQRRQKAVVICPAGISVQTGLHFYCAAQSGGEVTPFLVTVRAGGKLSYKGVSQAKTPSVNMTQTEIAIAQAMRADHEDARSVSCPQEMPLQQGLEFVCVATTGAKHLTAFVVRETNSLGRVSFRPR